MPPQPGSTGQKRHRKWCRFSSWVGAANWATRTCRESSSSTSRWIAPPLPEASQPSKSTSSGGPSSPGPIWPPSSSRRWTRRSWAAFSCALASFLDRRTDRSTSARRLMGASLALPRRIRSPERSRQPGRSACCRIQACMAMPAATPALIGPGGAELGDGQDAVGGVAGLVGQAGALLAEQEHAGPRELGRLQRPGPRQVVDGEQRQVRPARPVDQPADVGVVPHVLVAVGHHRAPPVPAPAARRCAPPRRGTRSPSGRRCRC